MAYHGAMQANEIQLPKPNCESGYTQEQLAHILGPRLGEFQKWHYGQTGAICEGRRYSHDTKQYYESCGGVSHGFVVYAWDLERFMHSRMRESRTGEGS